MTVIEQPLADAVLDVLTHRQPCKAAVIARVLRKRGHGSITRRDVNRLLYGPLNNDVEQDASYSWSLRSNGLAPAESDEPADPPPQHREESNLHAVTDDRVPWLRMIERIRSGLPPAEHVDQITVGYETVFPFIDTILDAVARQSRWMIVKGDYGDGKTHFLSVLRSRAHAAGYATCYLCSDSGNNALNHPQRFLHGLLGTLEFPPARMLGIESVAHTLALTTEGRNLIGSICRTRSVTSRMPFCQILDDLEVLDRCQRENRHQLVPAASFRLAEGLSGATISHRSAGDYAREAAYCLLRIAIDLIKERGCRGIVLLVDEAESIFTKLWSSVSREGAFRVLSALCEGPQFEDCVVALAVTPDACTRMRNEVEPLPAYRRLPFECMESFSENMSDGTVPVVDCHSLAETHRPELIEAVRRIYSNAYPELRSSAQDSWNQFANEVQERDIPIRVLVRQVVDFLDIHRYDLLGTDGQKPRSRTPRSARLPRH